MTTRLTIFKWRQTEPALILCAYFGGMLGMPPSDIQSPSDLYVQSNMWQPGGIPRNAMVADVRFVDDSFSRPHT